MMACAIAATGVLILLLAGRVSCALPAINVTTVPFADGCAPLFGFDNILRSADDRTVSLLLDRSTGSGFISSSMYQHGFFSASIKLPSDYTAGIVVAFYTSNADVFEKTHDELDFEFLGNIRGKPWRVQTNLYGNGSVSRGREERYHLPFDPTTEFHRYSILWTADNIIFYIDDTPIREVRRSDAMAGDYPSKPMSLYATIWDASSWATSGGRYKVNYRYGPFVSSFTDLALFGCPVDPIQMLPSAANSCGASMDDLMASGLPVVTPEKQHAMRRFRQQYMTYSYCYDMLRYPGIMPECDVVESEKKRFKESGHLRFALRRRRRAKGGRSAGVPLTLTIDTSQEANV